MPTRTMARPRVSGNAGTRREWGGSSPSSAPQPAAAWRCSVSEPPPSSSALRREQPLAPASSSHAPRPYAPAQQRAWPASRPWRWSRMRVSWCRARGKACTRGDGQRVPGGRQRTCTCHRTSPRRRARREASSTASEMHAGTHRTAAARPFSVAKQLAECGRPPAVAMQHNTYAAHGTLRIVQHMLRELLRRHRKPLLLHGSWGAGNWLGLGLGLGSRSGTPGDSSGRRRGPHDIPTCTLSGLCRRVGSEVATTSTTGGAGTDCSRL